MLPIIEANRADLVTSDHALNDHVRLSPTPGHTPDHFAVCAGKGFDAAVLPWVGHTKRWGDGFRLDMRKGKVSRVLMFIAGSAPLRGAHTHPPRAA